MFDLIKNIVPTFDKVEVAAILDAGGYTVGWHSNALSRTGRTIGGGTCSTRDSSIRVALAESIERSTYLSLLNSSLANRFRLDAFPSTCGFAAGFEKKSTLFRAICEAVERWAWSKWIDARHFIPDALQPQMIGALGTHFLSHFPSSRFFRRTMIVEGPQIGILELELCIFLGITDRGVFPGSRVCTKSDDLWTHSIVEAWRHKRIFDSPDLEAVSDTFPFNRIRHFGHNSEAALRIIDSCQGNTWPRARLTLVQDFQFSESNVYLFRALCDDYIGWHEGDERRFVY